VSSPIAYTYAYTLTRQRALDPGGGYSGRGRNRVCATSCESHEVFPCDPLEKIQNGANRLIWREYRGVMTDQFEQARAEAEAQVEQARAEKAAKDSAIAAALRQSQEQAERVARQARESLVVRPEVPPFGELVHGQRQGLRCLADRSPRRVRPELRAATATVGPDVASRDLLDHQQSVGYQLDCELPEGVRRHVRGNQRLGRADRTALELRLLRA
jgi:hypothetical protein